jgi:hypothetical protein
MKRNELPIVSAAYRMAQDLIPAVDRMPRGLRSLVGSELLRDVVGLQTCLHEAALHRGRRSALERADVHLTRIRVASFGSSASAPWPDQPTKST